jgi:hypothetical protein
MSGLFGGGKSSTSSKGWISPSLGLQDPYLLNALYGRARQYGIGDQGAFSDITNVINANWPEIIAGYTGKANKHAARYNRGVSAAVPTSGFGQQGNR